MSSVTVSDESAAIWMSEWKESMTQPSSAAAGVAETTFAHSTAMAPNRSLPARIFIDSPYIALLPL